MPSLDIDVWRAELDDLELLVPLFDGYRRFYGLPTNLDLCRSFLADRIGRNESVVFVAGARGGPASGFTQMYPSFGSLSAGRIWILYDLFVAVGARGKGVGRLLMERARHHGLETAARAIVLSTARTNDVAQGLYESLGYKRDDEFLTYELALPAV